MNRSVRHQSVAASKDNGRVEKSEAMGFEALEADDPFEHITRVTIALGRKLINGIEFTVFA